MAEFMNITKEAVSNALLTRKYIILVNQIPEYIMSSDEFDESLIKLFTESMPAEINSVWQVNGKDISLFQSNILPPNFKDVNAPILLIFRNIDNIDYNILKYSNLKNFPNLKILGIVANWFGNNNELFIKIANESFGTNNVDNGTIMYTGASMDLEKAKKKHLRYFKKAQIPQINLEKAKNKPQQPLNVPQRQANITQIPAHIPRQQANITSIPTNINRLQQHTKVEHRSSKLQRPEDIPQQQTNITQIPAYIPQQQANIELEHRSSKLQQPENITPIPTNIPSSLQNITNYLKNKLQWINILIILSAIINLIFIALFGIKMYKKQPKQTQNIALPLIIFIIISLVISVISIIFGNTSIRIIATISGAINLFGLLFYVNWYYQLRYIRVNMHYINVIYAALTACLIIPINIYQIYKSLT